MVIFKHVLESQPKIILISGKRMTKFSARGKSKIHPYHSKHFALRYYVVVVSGFDDDYTSSWHFSHAGKVFHFEVTYRKCFLCGGRPTGVISYEMQILYRTLGYPVSIMHWTNLNNSIVHVLARRFYQTFVQRHFWKYLPWYTILAVYNIAYEKNT